MSKLSDEQIDKAAEIFLRAGAVWTGHREEKSFVILALRACEDAMRRPLEPLTSDELNRAISGWPVDRHKDLILELQQFIERRNAALRPTPDPRRAVIVRELHGYQFCNPATSVEACADAILSALAELDKWE
jgi:hypothetical protein